MYGPTQVGKTILARSLGPHSYFNNLFSVDAYRPDSTYAVFDDMAGGLRSIPFKCWLGGQTQFTVTDKYKKKQCIYWGKPSIYIANDDPLTEKGLTTSDKEWLKGNATIIFISNSIIRFPKSCI